MNRVMNSVINEQSVIRINDYRSLINFLKDELEWPIPFDVKSERITYEYLSDELRLSDEDQKHLEGNIKQLIPFRQNQPWGIFLLELTKPKAYISLLRKIVRGLVPSKRKTSELSSWHHENVLLICTYKYEYFTFARFEGEHYSNSKITTFSWSPDEPVRTLCEHNLPALKWPMDDGKDTDKWLKNWASAFDVEKVTKKFFQEYKQLYELLYQDLSNNHIFRNQAVKHNLDASNFAKKLLGQIVFIYFIQKKGWLGVPRGENWGNGNKRFLRNLYDACIAQNDNFFNNYLEPLFYDALNNPRRNEVDPSYNARFKCKIPFLNGGLFEPEYDWSNSNVYIDNKIFEQILNVFDSYNFTVKEDTPLDVEVAVDPEMLGKVFENLLEENLRKGKGTYYTPREIVHYMCQESLINYISSESGIENEKIRKLMISAYITYSEDEISQEILGKANELDKLLVGIKV